MLVFVDWTLTLLHFVAIGLNVFGWMWGKTRKYSLICLGATVFCWAILGMIYGYGFSPLTAVQWTIKEAMGVKDLPDSYFVYLLQTVWGFKVNAAFVGGLAWGVLTMSIVSALFIQLRSRGH